MWSWDISKLLGPAKWTYFYLYVILDVFSRFVVGWTVQYRETAQLAKALIEQRKKFRSDVASNVSAGIALKLCLCQTSGKT